MNIIFFILKIIGILLLVIFFLAVLLIFHPMYYCVKGESEEQLYVKGYVWWLFQILRLEFEVKDSVTKIRVRIFGFPKNLNSDTKSNDFAEEIPNSTESGDFDTAETIETVHKESDMKTTDGDIKERKTDTGKQNKTSKEKKIKTTKHRFSDLKGMFTGLKKEVSDERNKLAVSKFWQEFVYLLSHLKPKYIKTDISFSMGDPALTGQVTGVLSLLPVLYQYDAHIYPDFAAEEFYIRGNMAIKGHMALVHAIRSGIHILKDKNIRRLWNRIRK